MIPIQRGLGIQKKKFNLQFVQSKFDNPDHL